jgi:hypothetical protein
VPYIHVNVPSGTVIGETVDAQIGKTQARVTLISESHLRIEPDAGNPAVSTGYVCRILACTSQDGRMTICVASPLKTAETGKPR